MNFQKFYKKNITLLLIISIISINFSFFSFAAKTEAVFGVGDVSTVNLMSITDPSTLAFYTTMQAGISVIGASTGATAGSVAASGVWQAVGKYSLEALLAGLAKQAALALVKQITQATVDWINGGFNGNPAYVGNLNKFLIGPGGVADRAVGNFFANEPGLRFLCEPFKVQVSLALQLHYGATLVDRLGCTYSAISQNIQGAIDNSNVVIDANGNRISVNRSNFEDKGGWNAWLAQTLQPQNTAVGAYYTAQGAMEEEIAQQKMAASMELTFGQGALTYKKCVDVYLNKDGGEVTRSKEYTENGGNRPTVPVSLQSVIVKTVPQCTVKTPGSTITGMLREKANSSQKMTEVQAALANGIDNIINALLNQLIASTKEKILKGVLDDDKNSPATQAYNNFLINSPTMISGLYSNSITSGNIYMPNTTNPSTYVPSMWTYNPGTGLPFSTSTWAYDPVTGLPSVFSTSTSYGPSNWNYDPTTGLPSVWSYDPLTGGTAIQNTTVNNLGSTGSDPLTIAKNNSSLLINSLLKSELTYQNNYKVVQNVLTEAKRVFATSSACNLSYNNNSSILRSLLIRANVISNIEGTPNSDRTIASIPWNLEVIKTKLDKSNINVGILNKAASDLRGAGSLTAVTDAMTQVNSTSFNTDPQTKMLNDVKTWLTGVGGIYNSLFCSIDLSKVLQINSATSTIN